MTGPRPRIVITAGSNPGTTNHTWLRFDYLHAVSKAHGLPSIVASGFTNPLEEAEQLAGEILDNCDGLMLSGGTDVDPEIFGEIPHTALGRVDGPRDPFEITLAREAVRRDLPVLGICRGLQVLNVAMGGTLIQDIPSDIPGAARHEAGENRVEIAHEVEVVPGSKLAELLSARRVGVNSFHHQAAKRIGEGLTVSATSPDGIVEGLEMRDRTFVVAVQWHPENFWKTSPVFDGLFTGFVEAARRAALSRRSPRSS
ncbi:MAG TPA: gamma-glutamyl-gamma-aminobutyrate hydrolase family protein [Vicinamibacteria bacterium]|nr:gamma-glutamyl-gamma-aminobutyrate hydrolase family protein [Vicinamibacteria bacterium]HRB12352.1 gamma-glutamyl-gamma-aminobutyrate hydrolase family protein [Vicinamibacteria bacterium]